MGILRTLKQMWKSDYIERTYMTSTPITPHIKDACIRYRAHAINEFKITTLSSIINRNIIDRFKPHIPSHHPIQTLTIKPNHNKHVPPPNTPQRRPSAQTPNPSPRVDAQHFDTEQTAHGLQIRFFFFGFGKRYRVPLEIRRSRRTAVEVYDV